MYHPPRRFELPTSFHQCFPNRQPSDATGETKHGNFVPWQCDKSWCQETWELNLQSLVLSCKLVYKPHEGWMCIHYKGVINYQLIHCFGAPPCTKHIRNYDLRTSKAQEIIENSSDFFPLGNEHRLTVSIKGCF